MMELVGRKIWLVGASTGIGEALAHRLAQQGAMLALSARNEEKLVSLSKALVGNVHGVFALDVTEGKSVTDAWNRLTAGWGVPDMVIYNAGAYEPMGAKAFNLEQAEAMLDVNFRGMLRVLSCALPSFTAVGKGHIVLVGSVAGYCGLPNAIGYGASKAAVIHLAENLRADLASTGITVQLVSPGFVKTRLTDKNTFSMPFIITPEEAARRIVDGMGRTRFEIAFPARLSLIFKFLRLLPYALYFRLIKRAIVKE